MTSAFVQPYSKPPARREAGGKLVLPQPRGKSPHLWALSLFHSYIYCTRQCLLLCVCYLCVVLSALSYSGWEWLMLLQHHALALGVPHESLPGPSSVTVGFTGCSWGTVELITGWDFHCFMQSFIMIQMARNRKILMRIFWARGRGQCACVIHARVCLCVRRLRFHWLRTDLPLRKRSWFPAKVK